MDEWKEVYKLPLKDSYIDGDFRSKRINDSCDNFVFQFLNVDNRTQELALGVINGTETAKHKEESPFSHESGNILFNGTKFIWMRGWGNLTGVGGHNLDPNFAAKVQDSFADFIVERLNNKE